MTDAIAESNENNNLAVSGRTIEWPEPRRDLTGAIDMSKVPLWLIPGDQKYGTLKKLPLLISNLGNVPAVGTITIDLYASLDQTLDRAPDVKLGTLTATLGVSLGRPAKLSFSNFVVPVLSAGDCYPKFNSSRARRPPFGKRRQSRSKVVTT